MSAEQISALAGLVTAAAAAFVVILRELRKVHGLVNAQLEKVMARLDVALGERDEARQQNEHQQDPRPGGTRRAGGLAPRPPLDPGPGT